MIQTSTNKGEVGVRHMSDHYYSAQPQSTHITETHTCTLNNNTFTFTTGAGVFSKKGIDFGTRVLIDAFAPPKDTGDILDLGCGYGPIGISIAKSNPNRSIVMVDINQRAVELATQNAKKNAVDNVSVIASDGFDKVPDQKTFSVIITNPPIRTGKKVLYPLFEESASRIQTGGELWMVIQKKQGATSMESFLATLFEEVQIVKRKKGYVIMRAMKS
jgi:16S rRNA (guanine1207-N2)-methyltransferase